MRIRFPAETFSDTGVVSAGPCNPGKWSLQALLSIPWKREAQTPEAPGGVGPGKAPWESVFLPIRLHEEDPSETVGFGIELELPGMYLSSHLMPCSAKPSHTRS